MKEKPVIDENPRNVEEIVIPQEKKYMKCKTNWEKYYENGIL